jgi:hypothetical protein
VCEARLVRPRWRPARAARVPHAVARLEAQEGGLGEGDVLGEAARLGKPAACGEGDGIDGRCG